MERADWLLLFIGLTGGKYATDQLRVMKGMFLLDQEGPQELRGLYRFQAYDYGPFDSSVYSDLDALNRAALISITHGGGTSRRQYEVTARGSERVVHLQREVTPTALGEVQRVKNTVTSLGFTDLLKKVYRDYPDYAIYSVAKNVKDA